MKQQFANLIGLASLAAAYNDSLQDCMEFAAQFRGSCGSVTESDEGTYTTWLEDDIMCRQDFNAEDKMKCPNDGNESSTCFLTRRNCATCRIKANGDVFIRYQSNGIPSHCYGSSYDDKSGYPTDQNIDFEVRWNTDVSKVVNYPL